MKHLSRLLLASFFVLCCGSVQAQDENNPWALGLGINAVDYYPTGEDAPLGAISVNSSTQEITGTSFQEYPE